MTILNGLWDSERYGVGAFYFDAQPTTYTGHIGAFYFGSDYAYVDAPLMGLSAEFLLPEIQVVESESNNISPNRMFLEFRLLQPKAIYSYQDIKVSFVGVPRRGTSPLVVDFTGTVEFGGSNKNKYYVKQYVWCFDYDYVNDLPISEWVTSDINTITNVYNGHVGQAFSVKLIAILGLK